MPPPPRQCQGKSQFKMDSIVCSERSHFYKETQTEKKITKVMVFNCAIFFPAAAAAMASP